jgi:hypothetical protein
LRAAAPIVVLCALLAAPAAVWGAGKVSFLPTFTLYGEWTDNLLLTPEREADEKLAAFSLVAEPGLRIRYDTYRTEAAIYGSAAFRHVFDHEEYDGWPEYYRAGLAWGYWITPAVRTVAGDEIIYFTDPRTQPFSQGRTLDTLRTESINNRLFTTTTWTATRLSSLEGGYSFSTTEFKQRNLYDTVEHDFALTWTQQLSATHRLIIFYDYARNLFSHNYDFLRHYWDSDYAMDPPFPYDLTNPADFDTHIPGVGLQYLATPSLTFDMRSGVVMPAVERRGVYQMSDLEWYQRMEVSKLFWRMQATGTYTRTYAPAHGLLGAVLANSVGARLDERWTRRWETYQEAGFTNYAQPTTNIDAWSATAAVNYYFFNWLGVGAGYNFVEQTGGPEDGPTDKILAHRVVVRLGMSSPRPDWLQF